MRFLKLGLISIVAIFCVMLFFSILMPSMVLVSRAVDISAPVDSIKYRVSDLNQWTNWINGMQSKTVSIKSAREAQLGSSTVIINTITDTTVVTGWTSSTKSFQLSTIRFITRPNSTITTVQWQFEQHLNWYPWEKFGSFMNDKILGPMMEQNLLNLKHLAENQPVFTTIPQ
jgi:hypothetical protein